ncbi:MAG: hypothetical protein H6Q58_1555 [Firmicutes bacterium]|nr:hypothetical protein [Bacillota bacterium]
MDYEKILTIIVAFACVIQVYFSFIKGRGDESDYGREVHRLRQSALKLRFLGLLFVFILFYLIYALMTSNISFLGVLVVVYVIISIYDFSKTKIITEKGFGEKSIYDKRLYNFIKWDDLEGFEWSEKRETMLVFKYKKRGELQMNDWEVCLNDKNQVDALFREHTASEDKKNQD